MTKDDVALVDGNGSTALHTAAICGNTEAAKLLVEKNPDLANMEDNTKNLPIHYASIIGRRSMVLYLLDLTNKEIQPKLLEDESGAILINGLIASNQFDIVILLIKRYPALACIQSSPALDRIALKRSAFPSGAHFNFWQSLIYSYVPPRLEDSAYQSSEGDIENPVNSAVSFRAYLKQKLHQIFWKLTQMLVPQMKKIQEKKREHHQARQLLELLCKEVVKLDYSKAKEIFHSSVLIAAKVGIPEVIEETFAVFPDVINATNSKGDHIFRIAILNRHVNIFNLIYQLNREVRHLILAIPDLSDKSCLDLVACLKDEQSVNLRAGAAGAALQMQRELQWYKEVEKFSLDYHKDNRDLEREVPRKEFSKTHEKLVKEGEEWMKDTANSCTIVAALIVTIAFAAAITVPGGNNGNNGHPIFSNDKVFLIFSLSDALALYSSTSSLLVFLSILTSRYGEEDFLEVLPNRLIIGLVTLFVSIISMMIAFGATVYLVFGDKKPWIFVPIAVLSCIPATLFVSSQFPLLLDMIKSTYGKGLFYQQNDRILY
ncbi:ankyrin repeat-containing protein ITN1-like [Cornus florida]|uniref:ankyrin repeat-containing protein ITN1-like n=1 Tax=Cornus florida TaxID=4283 RepID=UPI0028A18897|nr:ankyrin repeat-containing protein ITN1-like [Cornus florida]